MLEITKNYLTSTRNRPALRNRTWYTIRKLKGIVIHWTANESVGANAVNNRRYFNTADRYASAHYLVDDHSIIQCIPDNEVAYHVGGRYYKPTAYEIMENDLTPNYFLIGVEMCVNKDGNWSKTYKHSVELVQHLLNKYNFTIKDLYRHYDITGKYCPLMMIDEKPWQDFKDAVNAGLTFALENPIKRGYINTSELNIRKGPGIQYPIIEELTQNAPVEIFEEIGNWYRIGDDKWGHNHYIEITFTAKDGIVQDPTGLNVRTGPGSSHSVVEVLADGAKVTVIDQDRNWYKIGHNKWVYNAYIKLMEVKTGRVIAPSFLNVRTGPGTNNPRVAQLQRDALVKIYEEEGRWMRIGDDQWVFGAFIRLID